jgi:hypothetical protein
VIIGLALIGPLAPVSPTNAGDPDLGTVTTMNAMTPYNAGYQNCTQPYAPYTYMFAYTYGVTQYEHRKAGGSSTYQNFNDSYTTYRYRTVHNAAQYSTVWGSTYAVVSGQGSTCDS